VPICSTVGEESPSIPIQNAAYDVSPAAQVTGGTTQEPVTSETDPTGPVTTYPLQFVLVAGPTLIRGGWAKSAATPRCGGVNSADLSAPVRYPADGRLSSVGMDARKSQLISSITTNPHSQPM
jgi:hypothetical protein